MLTRGYVCRRCQANSLRHTVAAFEAQWHARASFISLSHPPQQAQEATEEEPHTTVRPHQRDDVDNRARPSRPRRATPSQPAGRYSGTAVPLPFQDSYGRNNQRVQHGRGQERFTPRESAGTASRLDELLSSPDTLREAWSYFLKHYTSRQSPSLLSPAYQDLRHLQYGEVFKKLLHLLATAWAKEPGCLLPRPSVVRQRLQELGIWRIEFWEAAGWPLARALFLLDHQKATDQHHTVAELSNELVSLWVGFLSQYSKHAQYISKDEGIRSLNWALLQQSASLMHNLSNTRLDTSLLAFLEGFPPKSLRDIPSFALISGDLLSKDMVVSSLSGNDKLECTELMKTLLLLISGKTVSRPAENLRNILGNFDGAVSSVSVDDYVRYMQDLPIRAFATAGATEAQRPRARQDVNVLENNGEVLEDGDEILTQEEVLVQVFSRRIHRIRKMQNVAQLQKCWEGVRASYQKKEDGNKTYDVPAILYDQLIAAFFSMRRGDMALEIWSFMIKHGTQPTTKTWTAMMDGARAAKDFKAVDGIWDRMFRNDVQLDEVAWIVRVTSLVQCNRLREALATLEELGQRWSAASRVDSTPTIHTKSKKGGVKRAVEKASGRDLSATVQPNIGIVNAVLTPLAKVRNGEQYIARILEWAKTFGLSPDTYTYNALIIASLTKGNASDADRLLRQMSVQGIEPDSATYSIILDHIVTNLPTDSLSAEQIQAKALAALEGLEAKGMKVNEIIYSQLIVRLLQNHNNLPAAQAVLTLQLKQGLEPTEIAYTALIKHYFSLSPPDVASVSAIVDRIPSSYKNVNNNLYKHLLQGYADSDAIPPVMRTLWRMKKEKRHPTWEGLKAVALAMERAEEWNLLSDLVGDVEAKQAIVPLEDSKASLWMKGIFFGIVWRLRAEGKLVGDSLGTQHRGMYQRQTREVQDAFGTA